MGRDKHCHVTGRRSWKWSKLQPRESLRWSIYSWMTWMACCLNVSWSSLRSSCQQYQLSFCQPAAVGSVTSEEFRLLSRCSLIQTQWQTWNSEETPPPTVKLCCGSHGLVRGVMTAEIHTVSPEDNGRKHRVTVWVPIGFIFCFSITECLFTLKKSEQSSMIWKKIVDVE